MAAAGAYGGARGACAAKAPASAIAAAALAAAALAATAANIAAAATIAAAGCSDGNLGPDFSDGNLRSELGPDFSYGNFRPDFSDGNLGAVQLLLLPEVWHLQVGPDTHPSADWTALHWISTSVNCTGGAVPQCGPRVPGPPRA